MGPWGSHVGHRLSLRPWGTAGHHRGPTWATGSVWDYRSPTGVTGVSQRQWGSHGVRCSVHSASPGCSSGRNFRCPEPSPSLSLSRSPSRHPVVVSGWVTPAPCACQALAGSLRPQPRGAVGGRGIPIRAARPRVRGMKDAQTKLGSRDLYCGPWQAGAVGRGSRQGWQAGGAAGPVLGGCPQL